MDGIPNDPSDETKTYSTVSTMSAMPSPAPDVYTGGKGSITQWVHAKYMVGQHSYHWFLTLHSKVHNAGEGLKVESSGVSYSLSCLVKMIIGTHPVKDSHVEQVE